MKVEMIMENIAVFPLLNITQLFCLSKAISLWSDLWLGLWNTNLKYLIS